MTDNPRAKKPKSKTTLVEDVTADAANTEIQTPVEVDISQCDAEQQVEIISEALHEFCDHIEAGGVDPVVTHTTLLSVFNQRMQLTGDREQFEEALALLIEESWPDDLNPTLH